MAGEKERESIEKQKYEKCKTSDRTDGFRIC